MRHEYFIKIELGMKKLYRKSLEKMCTKCWELKTCTYKCEAAMTLIYHHQPIWLY